MIDRKTTRAPAVDTGISVTSISTVQLNIVLAFYTRMRPVLSLVSLIVVPMFSSNAIATSDVCEFSVVFGEFVLLGASRIAFIQFAMSQIT